MSHLEAIGVVSITQESPRVDRCKKERKKKFEPNRNPESRHRLSKCWKGTPEYAIARCKERRGEVKLRKIDGVTMQLYDCSRWLSRARCSPNTRRLISRTVSNPSRPREAFSRNRSTLASSTLFLIFCHPPQRAVIFASWLNSVVVLG